MTEPRAERPHMPDYGVGAVAWTALPWAWAADRLIPARNYWVVTVSGGGRPHALPVWGVWDDEEHRFGFSCGPGSRKARNLRENDRMVVMTEDTVECLSIEGRAEFVTDAARQDHWVERYLAKYAPLAPGLDGGFIRANLLVELTPERAFGIIEREEEFAGRATRWIFGGAR